MSAELLFNTGDDVTPIWLTWDDILDAHFTGPNATSDLAEPILRPTAGYVWNTEVWIGPAIMVGGVKVESWTAPNEAVQTGKVFKVVFDVDCDAAPYLSAFDDDSFSTWETDILAGTDASDFTGLVKAYITGTEAANTPPPQNWAQMETGQSGSMNPNALAGNSTFVTVPFIPNSGEDFTFTIALAIPYDAESGKDDKYAPRLAVTYIHV